MLIFTPAPCPSSCLCKHFYGCVANWTGLRLDQWRENQLRLTLICFTAQLGDIPSTQESPVEGQDPVTGAGGWPPHSVWTPAYSDKEIMSLLILNHMWDPKIWRIAVARWAYRAVWSRMDLQTFTKLRAHEIKKKTKNSLVVDHVIWSYDFVT